MKSKILGFLMAFVAMFSMSSCGYERVDAGHEGIKVNLYGDNKGVDDISLVTGAVWYNPITEAVYEYPTFAQTVDYEAFEVNSKDGTKFKIDPSMLVKIEDGKSPSIFRKYRKGIDDIVNGPLYVYVKDAARNVFNRFTADSIVSNRTMVDKAFDEQVRIAFEKEGFKLEQLTPGISYPKSYEDAINAKNKAIQDQMRVQNEIAVAEANAKKVLVQAEAEAEANRLKQQALTPQILEKMWIEKWSGDVPTVMGTNNSVFYDLNTIRKK